MSLKSTDANLTMSPHLRVYTKRINNNYSLIGVSFAMFFSNEIRDITTVAFTPCAPFTGCDIIFLLIQYFYLMLQYVLPKFSFSLRKI